MKAKWGSLVVDGRGKIGGHVASKNRFGSYFRTKTSPVNPNTNAQQAVRQLFAQLTQGWGGLTQAQRKAWADKANGSPEINIFGDQVIPTGKNLYVGRNTNLINVGGVIQNVPTDSAGQAEGLGFDIVATASTTPDVLTVTANYQLASGDGTFILTASGPVAPGVEFVKNKFRVVFAGTLPDGDTVNILSSYQSKFGALAVGQRIKFQLCEIQSNGYKSPGITTEVVVS